MRMHPKPQSNQILCLNRSSNLRSIFKLLVLKSVQL